MRTLILAVMAMGCGPAVEPLKWSLGAPCAKWGESQCLDVGRLVICNRSSMGQAWQVWECKACPGPQMPLDGCDPRGELCSCG